MRTRLLFICLRPFRVCLLIVLREYLVGHRDVDMRHEFIVIIHGSLVIMLLVVVEFYRKYLNSIHVISKCLNRTWSI